MSLTSKEAWRDRAPSRNPNQFEPGETWASYLRKNVFHELKNGEPFLIVQRRIEKERVRSDMSSRDGRDTMKVTYYIGWLAKEGPLFYEHEDGLHDVEIRVESFHKFPKSFPFSTLHTEPEGVRFHSFELRHTPLTEPFEPPFDWSPVSMLERSKTRAFDVAVGIEAMEVLSEQEAQHEKSFASWYVRSARKLGISLVSDAMKNVLAVERQKVLTRLFAKHSEIIRLGERAGKSTMQNFHSEMKHLLETAHEYGMAEDSESISIDGLRFIPQMLLEDFAVLYP